MIKINKKKLQNLGNVKKNCPQIWSPVDTFTFSWIICLLSDCFYSFLEKRRHSTKESQTHTQDSSMI